MLDDLNSMQMLVIGIVTGVVASYLIVATYLLAGRAAAKRRLAEFFDKYGALKGVDYYTKISADVDDADIKNMVAAATERYIALAREHEREIDSYLKSPVTKE